jgi:hypothetical protein
MGLGEALGHAKDIAAQRLGPSAEERRLFEDGAAGEGVVTSHEMIARSQFGRENFYSLVVRFRSGDGTEAEFDCPAVKRDKVGMLETGDKVPVRYDPADPSKATLDMPALEARYARQIADIEAQKQSLDDEKVAKAQAEIDGRVWTPSDPQQQASELVQHRMDVRPGLAWTPVGDQLLPVEVEAKAGTGGLTVDGAIAELIEAPAEAAVAYVSQHAAELLPELGADWFESHDVRVFQPYGGLPDGVTAAEAEGAGLPIVAALVSLLGAHVVRTDVALTGALTPTGELRPSQGLKGMKKVAERAYTRRLVAPAADGQGAEAGSQHQDQGAGLEVVFASTVPDALRAALAKHRLEGYAPPA